MRRRSDNELSTEARQRNESLPVDHSLHDDSEPAESNGHSRSAHAISLLVTHPLQRSHHDHSHSTSDPSVCTFSSSMPLIGIPRIISPDLLKILAEMGHGDELCLADANFPAQSIAEAQTHPRIVRMPAADNVQLLAAILKLMPLDQYVEQPVGVMRRVPADEAADFPVAIYAEFQRTLDATRGGSLSDASSSASGASVSMELVERFAFYERAKKCFAVVQTGERRQYGNIIIKKGVVRAEE